MKLSITPVAVAVAMAFGAAAAQAQQTLPSYGSTAPSGNTGLYLAVWDTTTSTTELVNLTATYPQTDYSGTPATAALTSQTSGFSNVANPAGAGNVLQLDLGPIAGFSSLFPSSQTANTDYLIVAANTAQTGFVTSEAVGADIPLTASAVKTVTGAILGEEAEWAGATNTSPASDTTGTAGWSVANAANGSLGGGDEGLSGQQFGAVLGTAANFFNDTGSSTKPFSSTEYTYNGQAGFWFLSATGDLTWNLPVASTVPLPPAVWLFASGLIGLGLIGRRRERDLGATA